MCRRHIGVRSMLVAINSCIIESFGLITCSLPCREPFVREIPLLAYGCAEKCPHIDLQLVTFYLARRPRPNPTQPKPYPQAFGGLKVGKGGLRASASVFRRRFFPRIPGRPKGRPQPINHRGVQSFFSSPLLPIDAVVP